MHGARYVGFEIGLPVDPGEITKGAQDLQVPLESQEGEIPYQVICQHRVVFFEQVEIHLENSALSFGRKGTVGIDQERSEVIAKRTQAPTLPVNKTDPPVIDKDIPRLEVAEKEKRILGS
jgi:hypothetical protein